MNAFERKLEELSRLIWDLRERTAEGAIIIVEGRKDVESLRRLGISGMIFPAKSSGRPFLDVIGEIGRLGAKEAILLMDFDRRGREWTKRLMEHLEAMKVKSNITFWRRLIGLTGREVKDVEGLARYLETLSEKIGKNILGGNQ